ncbi:MAG: DMT family transporter [Thermonemataceae bacterium]
MRLSKGVQYILLATLLFAFMNVLVKQVDRIPAVEVVLFRSAISLVICLVSLRAKKVSVWGHNKPVLIARGAFGATSLVLFFITLQNIPLARATVLHYVAPIFTAIIAAVFLSERLRWWQLLFFLISFTGVFFIKNFDDEIPLLYFSTGVISAFFAGCAYNCIRKLKTTEHPLVIVFYFPLVTLPIVSIASFFWWVTPQGIEWLYLLGIGLLTQLAQVYMTKAYQTEMAARVAGTSYIGLLYALGLGFVFFEETFTWQVLTGMLLVVTGVILNLFFKNEPTIREKVSKIKS